MKTFILGMALALSTSAWAADSSVLGRLTLTVRPTFGGGFYTTEVRVEGNQVLGQTSFGSSGMVNVRYGAGKYEGSAGEGFVDLMCSDTHCSGLVNGASANFDVRKNGLDGALNYSHLVLNLTDNEISVRAKGSVDLRKTADGVYEGDGYLSDRPNSRVSVTLETSGVLKDLRDPGLLAILVADPFAL